MTTEDYFKLKDRQRELEILATIKTDDKDRQEIEKEYKDIYLQIKAANRKAYYGRK